MIFMSIAPAKAHHRCSADPHPEEHAAQRRTIAMARLANENQIDCIFHVVPNLMMTSFSGSS